MRLIKRFTGEEAGPTELPLVAEERSSGSPAPLKGLTTRELEVLALLAQGMSNPEIAEKLSISRSTAKVHVGHIINKLGVSDRTQAVIRAIELSLVDPETRQ